MIGRALFVNVEKFGLQWTIKHSLTWFGICFTIQNVFVVNGFRFKYKFHSSVSLSILPKYRKIACANYVFVLFTVRIWTADGFQNFCVCSKCFMIIWTFVIESYVENFVVCIWLFPSLLSLPFDPLISQLFWLRKSFIIELFVISCTGYDKLR